MAIVGVNDKVNARFPKLGTLRKGAVKSANRPGKDLQWFRFTSNDPEMVKLFKEEYGDKPNGLECYLPYEPEGDVSARDMNFNTHMAEFTLSNLVRLCDGANIFRQRMGEKATPCKIPCIKEDAKKPCNCKPRGHLHIILPKLIPTQDTPEGRFGYVEVLTGSIIDISQVSGQLDMVEQAAGTLTGIPFLLWRRPEKIASPGHGRQTKYMLSIEVRGDWILQQQVEAGQSRMMLGAGQTPEYDMPEEFEEDDGAVIIDAPTFEVKPDPPPIQTLDDIARGKEQDKPTEEPEPLDVSTSNNHEQVKAEFWRDVEAVYGWSEKHKLLVLDLAKQLGHEGLGRHEELLRQLKFSVNGCLAFVNKQVAKDKPYQHPNHMANALAKEGFAIDKDGWPEIGDEGGWTPIIETLISRRNDIHPESEEVIEEVQAEPNNPITDDEVPF